MNCSACHTTVPKLTKVGFNFRRAGFRMPDEIGADAKLDGLKDLYAARIREEFRVGGSATDGTAANAKVQASNKFAFHELTFYPITGAFGKYWAAESELSFGENGGGTEIENAYVRATYPINSDLFVTARAGIFHAFEGYGAADRTISNIRPLFQTTAVNGVKLWQDQEGLELGASWKDTHLTFAVLNGYNSLKGEANGGDDDNNRDYMLFFNQLIGEHSSVNAEFLTGVNNWANGNVAPSAASGLPPGVGTPAVVTSWSNHYKRAALYGNYGVLGPKLDLLAGGSIGMNHMMNAANTDSSDSDNSGGWFVSAESKVCDYFTGVLRYDTFRAHSRTSSNRLSAVTATAVVPLDNIKFMADYQVKRTQSGVGKDRTDNTLRAEWMYIF